jgi:hypothetical protein
MLFTTKHHLHTFASWQSTGTERNQNQAPNGKNTKNVFRFDRPHLFQNALFGSFRKHADYLLNGRRIVFAWRSTLANQTSHEQTGTPVKHPQHKCSPASAVLH